MTASVWLGVAGPSQSANASTIISTNFVSSGSNDSLDGTQVGLTGVGATNLPGGSWVWGAGWNWSAPLVNANWMGGTLQNAASLGEEKTAVGLSMASAGSYTKPTAFHLSALVETSDANHPNGRNALGFWSAMPARDNSQVSVTGFTGVGFTPDGTLTVIENGVAGATASTAAVALSTLYSLAYDVNTSSGAISNVVFNGYSVSLTSSAFTDAATTYVGYLTDSQSRGGFTSMVVSDVPEPASVGLLGCAVGLLMVRRRVHG